MPGTSATRRWRSALRRSRRKETSFDYHCDLLPGIDLLGGFIPHSLRSNRYEKARRDQLDKADAMMEEAKGIYEAARDEEQEAFDNLPEGLQQAERGQKMEEAIQQLDEAISKIEQVIDNGVTAQE